jgi:CRISPR system Cascade subunit CasC
VKELLEFHILQNFVPSNLNRDDSGSPKDAFFGGSRRARISSQSFKRAMRSYVREHELLPKANMAERSRYFNRTLVGKLTAAGKEEETAQQVVKLALETIGLKLDKKTESHTEYLLFLGSQELEKIASLIVDNWDDLETVATADKAKKKDKDAAVSKELKKALDKAVCERSEGGDAVDVALFGRMLADRPDKNQDAACQVAHAISTNKITKEFDFFTAVDDLKTEDESGSAHMGTTEFNSACFYRYIAVDLALLKQNLQDDHELLKQGLKAFAEAAVRAVPSGKQNSFAAHNPPSFIGVRYRKNAAPVNLANAFEKPVWSPDKSLSSASLEALDNKWARLDEFFEQEGETIYWSDNGGFSKGQSVKSISEMLDTIGGWASEN